MNRFLLSLVLAAILGAAPSAARSQDLPVAVAGPLAGSLPRWASS